MTMTTLTKSLALSNSFLQPETFPFKEADTKAACIGIPLVNSGRLVGMIEGDSVAYLQAFSMFTVTIHEANGDTQEFQPTSNQLIDLVNHLTNALPHILPVYDIHGSVVMSATPILVLANMVLTDAKIILGYSPSTPAGVIAEGYQTLYTDTISLLQATNQFQSSLANLVDVQLGGCSDAINTEMVMWWSE